TKFTRKSSAGQILAQPGFVELPVAVFAAVKQDDGKAVAEFGSERCVTVLGRCVDVGGCQIEVEFGGELLQLGVDAVADRAAGAGKEADFAAGHGLSVSGSHSGGKTAKCESAGEVRRPKAEYRNR